MDNFLYLNNQLTSIDFLSYFSGEIFLLVGVFINLFIYLFFKRKTKANKFSDYLTFSIFSLNSIILLGLIIRNIVLFGNFDINIQQNGMFLNNNILIKLFINMFMGAFLLSTYKIVRKTRIKTALLNSILLAITLFSSLLVQSFSCVLAYLIFEVVLFLIYKYGSNMRIRKTRIYSLDFILISLFGTILITAFYLTTLVIHNEIQAVVVRVCLILALFLKIGVFPVYNYLNIKYHKNSVPFSILLFSFLPFIGLVLFLKIVSQIGVLNEIYLITLSIFLIATLVCFALSFIKQKNLIKFIGGISYVYLTYSLINYLYAGKIFDSVYLSTCIMFLTLGLFSLLAIIKINNLKDKMHVSLIKGIFVKNKYFAIYVSLLLLLASNIIPSSIFVTNLSIIKNVYIFDKTGIYSIIFIFLANFLLLFNSCSVIRNCYKFDKQISTLELTKRTTLNYVVPFIVILFLFFSLFL